MKTLQLAASIVLTGSLIACGGGGGGGTTSPTPNPTPTPTPTPNLGAIISETQLNIGQLAEMLISEPGKTVSDISWQQDSGPAVTFFAANSKAIAVEVEQAGEYSFTVNYKADGVDTSKTLTFTGQDTTNKLSARLGHAVTEGNKVSLRTTFDSSIDTSSITWSQTAGVSASFSSDDSGVDDTIFFDAPLVTEDEILEFAVTATDANGDTHTDVVSIIVEDMPAIPSDGLLTSDNKKALAKVHAYNANSPYADALPKCVYSSTMRALIGSLCKLSELPLLAQDTTSPTLDDVMNRVVVSHQWMGDRFKDWLIKYDTNNDFKNMLRATTAVVISSDIRPSFFMSATGAIYLDADNFWLTAKERDTINQAPDYRGAFGRDLQFDIPWRYVKDNERAFVYYSGSYRGERDISTTLYRLAALLYHELAHANDFFAPANWASASPSLTPYEFSIDSTVLSTQLNEALPLEGDEMLALAQVSFQGAAATDAQKALEPSDVTNFFEPEAATDFYNYSTTREDLAMLFEEVVLHERYGLRRDVAVTTLPTEDVDGDGFISGNDYIVDWGQRGRVAQSHIIPRAKFVVERILPEFDVDAAIAGLPETTPMTSQNSWNANLVLGSSAKSAKKVKQNAVNMTHETYRHPQRHVILKR